jgi:hypothetical protein
MRVISLKATETYFDLICYKANLILVCISLDNLYFMQTIQHLFLQQDI